MTVRLILFLLARYRAQAHKNYLAGRRPLFLSCEQQLGGHCAELMERDLRQCDGIVGLRNHLQRCPRGLLAAVLGLTSAAVIAALGGVFGCEGDLCGCGECGRRRRRKARRLPFKKHYDLDRYQSISEFERRMIQGMIREHKEVFVTAFCSRKEVITATATIGSRFRCRPSDNALEWGAKACRLHATEIRQYHNHPAGRGASRVSPMDKESHRHFKELVEPYGIRFRSFLVYPRSIIGGYTIKEL